MVKLSTCKLRERGFSLLEMGIVLLIIASIVGGGMVIFVGSLDKQRWKLTQGRLQVIQKTLLDYRNAYNRIPCPSDITIKVSVANFGVEAANSTTCTGGTPAANFTYNSADYVLTATSTTTSGSKLVTLPAITGALVGATVAGTGINGGTTVVAVGPQSSANTASVVLSTAATASGTVSLTYTYDNKFVAGGVPTRTLRLPDDFAFDGWGRRFTYAADTSFTTTDAFVSIPVTDGLATRITIRDTATSPGTITTGASYAVISYGPNGHGAYPRSSTTRVNTGSLDANELINCHCTNAAADDASGYSRFAQGQIGATFDDIVVYATRAQLKTVKE